MELSSFVENYSVITIFALIILAFIAGFVDGVVGGGGLIQLPALLINLPETPLPTLFGTNKIAAISGTSVAAYQYSKRVKFNYKLLIVVAICAFAASYMGAKTVSFIDSEKLKPVILIILIVIAIYTFFKKDLGSKQTKALTFKKQLIFGSFIGLIVGFYDGFLGPGTGSFLVLGFVVILGFEFIAASAYSKIINFTTNVSALIVFINHGSYLLGIGLIMAISNVTGSYIGSKMALKKGNGFVRIIFLIIVTFMILKYGYDVFLN